jgi:hypothetical protein
LVLNQSLAAVVRAQRRDKLLALLLLITAIPWLVYTRLYFWLHPRSLTFDPSVFMYLTGRPDPTCGLTRTFAWMWQGQLLQAVAVYPLGPLVFLATVGLVVYAVAVVLSGRALRLQLGVRRNLTIAIVVALASNWMLKLIWLGM